MFRRLIRVTAAAAMLAVPTLSQAQAAECTTSPTCTINPLASLTIPSILYMSIADASVDFAVPTTQDLSAASTVAGTPFGDIIVRANTGWTLTLAASQANWDFNGGASTTRAATTLQYSLNGGAFTSVTTGGATLATGTRTNGAAAAANLEFQVTLPAGYDADANQPGTYTLPLVLNLTAP